MKNKNLKICFAIIMSFAMCSLKAQSLQQKFQKDTEVRKKNVNAVLLKAKEQQAQQQAEKINGTGSGNTIQPNIPVIPQEKKDEIKSPAPIKKPVTAQQTSPARKENIN